MQFAKNIASALLIGAFVMRKYRARAAESGTFTAAKQLRKQGYPIEVALQILC